MGGAWGRGLGPRLKSVVLGYGVSGLGPRCWGLGWQAVEGKLLGTWQVAKCKAHVAQANPDQKPIPNAPSHLICLILHFCRAI